MFLPVEVVELDQVEDPPVKRVHFELLFCHCVGNPGAVTLMELVKVGERVFGEWTARDKNEGFLLAETVDGLLEGEVTKICRAMHIFILKFLFWLLREVDSNKVGEVLLVLQRLLDLFS